MEDINDILAKHFSGEHSAENEKLIEAWKAENESEYAILSEAWNEKVTFKVYDNSKAWSKIEDQITETNTKTFRIGSIMKFAAAACFAVLIGWTANWYFSADEFLAFNNDTNQVQEYTLPDGSKIWLAPDSELQYANDFEENRDLILDGEAFFEVERDENHPFIIQTKYGEVEVLGTGFNVDCDENSTVVSVEHGLVALRNNDDEVKLSQGQSAESNENGLTEIDSVDDNFQSWKTGSFIFEDAPLQEVIEELNTYFEKEIIIESEKAKKELLTGNFNNQSLEDIIEIIVLTCDVQSESQEDKVILK